MYYGKTSRPLQGYHTNQVGYAFLRTGASYLLSSLSDLVFHEILHAFELTHPHKVDSAVLIHACFKVHKINSINTAYLLIFVSNHAYSHMYQKYKQQSVLTSAVICYCKRHITVCYTLTEF